MHETDATTTTSRRSKSEVDAVRTPVGEQLDQALDGARLVARGLELRRQPEQRAQGDDGTATRYFRHESRKLVAWGWRIRCTENRNCGCTGSRMSRRRASSTVRFPLKRLQRRQAATTLVHVVCPPRERGMTWSTVSFSPR